MNTQLIITHPGGVHFDEVTAISLILAVHYDTEFRAERREPTEGELDNPDVWVIDIGNRHEPEKHNFDHHQSLECPAAFVLVADYLGLKASLSLLPWWDFKDAVDRFGPVIASTKFGAGDDLVNRNPLESWLVSRFAAKTQASLPMLKSYGMYTIEDAARLKRQIDFWKTSRRLEIKGIPAMIGETMESAGLEEFRRLEKNPPDIVISLDRRGGGWRLYRFDGAPVDFSRLSNAPEIEYAHKNGFMAKTRGRIPVEKLIDLVGLAVTRTNSEIPK
ncbi:MAG: MYG1 family protein [Dehalococcoidales bacterium]|nr:MYG1 family protein [Dehalococcoidales bacterium]